MSTRKSYALAACLWLVLIAGFFSPVLFQDKVLAPLDILHSLLRPWADSATVTVHNAYTYDAISQYLPYDWSVYQSLRQDGYIGWNPYTHSGSSIVENTMICPGDWHHHLYRFLPFWTAWNTGIILQFTLAGLGMLLLLREQKIPAAYALIGMVAFGFYSQFTLWICHRWVLGAMCWGPWILWAMLRAKKSGRIIHLPSIALIALAFRGGHLQTCIFVILLVLLVAAVDWWNSGQRWNIRQICNGLAPYAVCGFLAAVFAMDVVVETVPALLHGKRDMASRSWIDTLFGLPTLVTSVFPTIMGTPQGLDLMKAFRSDLFSIKFMGAVPLFLASLGFCRRQAPLTAKVLFLFGLLVPFTPADQWLYSRFTVVFALGGAWLAAWYLSTLAAEPPSKIWRRASLALALVAGIWLLGSVLVASQHAWAEAKLHDAVLANLPAGKSSRAAWMLARADAFLIDSVLWAPRNLAMLALIGLGLFAGSRIHNQNRRAPRFAVLVALAACGEMILFASTWITFSDRPAGDGLYAEPAWASRLKREVGDGTLLCLDRSDFDYMQLNTPSAYGIRFAEGYETVTPRRIDPARPVPYDLLQFSQSGISHLLVSPEKDPGAITGWEKIVASKEFVLYKNPLFKGLCTATLSDDSQLPLTPQWVSANRREILLPANVQSVVLMESFNPGWKFATTHDAWNPVRATELNGMQIDLEHPTRESSTRLQLQYRPAYQPYYRAAMGATAFGLLGFSLLRRRGMTASLFFR